MLSIHQDFVYPDPAERKKDVDHTIHCIQLASDLGIPAIRLNSGRWNTIKSFDDLMKVKGDEPPIAGLHGRRRLQVVHRVHRGLPARGGEGGRDARASRTTGG